MIFVKNRISHDPILNHFSLISAVIRFRSIWICTLFEYIALSKSGLVEVARWEVSASHVTIFDSAAHFLAVLPNELGEVTDSLTVAALVAVVVIVSFFCVPLIHG